MMSHDKKRVSPIERLFRALVMACKSQRNKKSGPHFSVFYFDCSRFKFSKEFDHHKSLNGNAQHTHKRTRIILGHKSISLTVNYTYFGFVDFLENATTARKLLYAPPKKKKKKRYRPKIWAHAARALSAQPHTIYSAHFEQESHEKVHRIGRIKTRRKKIHA